MIFSTVRSSGTRVPLLTLNITLHYTTLRTVLKTTTYIFDGKTMSTPSSESFEQSRFIAGIHNIPRFGHSNSIARIASVKRSEQEDYVRGLLAFVVFAAFTLYTCSVILTLFKTLLEPSNCAAGGSILDIAKLRKQKVPREERRRRIVRSWRVQWAFLVLSIFIPILTVLMMRHGLRPLINSLDEVESISNEVESIAFRGILIADSLTNLQSNFTGQNLAGVCSSSPPQQTDHSLFSIPVDTLANYVAAGMAEVDKFIAENTHEATIGLQRVVTATQRIDDFIVWIYQQDWLLKLFLMTINVVNTFFLIGLFLSKQDLVAPSYQRFLSYAMIPMFSILLICGMIVACVFGMAAMINAGKSLYCLEQTNQILLLVCSKLSPRFLPWQHQCGRHDARYNLEQRSIPVGSDLPGVHALYGGKENEGLPSICTVLSHATNLTVERP